MIYLNILNPKFRNLLKGIVLILVSIFTMTLFSCSATETLTYSPEELRAGNEDGINITEVTTKSYETINLEDNNASYNEAGDEITYDKMDTLSIKTESEKKLKMQIKIKSKISLQDIMVVQAEKTNTGLAILYTAGTIAGICLFFLSIFILTVRFDLPSR